jgi:hypothetical protein
MLNDPLTTDIGNSTMTEARVRMMEVCDVDVLAKATLFRGGKVDIDVSLTMHVFSNPAIPGLIKVIGFLRSLVDVPLRASIDVYI